MLTITMMYLNGASMVWGMYYTNQQYFELNCENKRKPELACHGKCQAMKEMRDLSKKQESFKEAAVFPVAIIQSALPVIVMELTAPVAPPFYTPLVEGYLLDFTSLIIHPPD